MDIKQLIKKGNDLGVDLSGLEEVNTAAVVGFTAVACTMMYLSFCSNKSSIKKTDTDTATSTTTTVASNENKVKTKKKKKSKKSKKKAAAAAKAEEGEEEATNEETVAAPILAVEEEVVVQEVVAEEAVVEAAVAEDVVSEEVVVEAAVVEDVVVQAAAPGKKRRVRKKKTKKENNTTGTTTSTTTSTTTENSELVALVVTAPSVSSSSGSSISSSSSSSGSSSSGSSSSSKSSRDADDGWVVVKKTTSREDRQLEKKLAAEEALATAFDVVEDGQPGGGLSDMVTHVMDLRDCVSIAFGYGGLNIRRIQDESGSRIDCPKGQSICTITGTPSSVALAVSELQQILDDNDTVTIDLTSSKGVGAIVGKAGVNIRRIESESGANLNIARGTFECTVTGNSSQLLKARALIAEYIEYGGPKPAYTETMTLEKREIFLVIGSAGATIRSIETATDCRLTLEGSTLTMSGELSAVDAAQDMVHSIIHENSYEIVIRLGDDRSVLGAVIGKAGANIHNVQRETGARCDRKNDEFLGNILVIVGTEAACKKAEKIFKTIITTETGPPVPTDGEVLVEIELGSSVGSVIGRAGATVNNIQSESGAVVQVKTGTVCYVVGIQESVDKAVAMIEVILEKQREYDAKKEAAVAARAALELAGGNTEEEVWNADGSNTSAELTTPSWETPAPEVVEDTWSGLTTDAEGW